MSKIGLERNENAIQSYSTKSSFTRSVKTLEALHVSFFACPLSESLTEIYAVVFLPAKVNFLFHYSLIFSKVA